MGETGRGRERGVREGGGGRAKRRVRETKGTEERKAEEREKKEKNEEKELGSRKGRGVENRIYRRQKRRIERRVDGVKVRKKQQGEEETVGGVRWTRWKEQQGRTGEGEWPRRERVKGEEVGQVENRTQKDKKTRINRKW